MIRQLFALMLILPAFLLAAAPARAVTYTLTPSQDTDVRQNGGGTANCGGCTTLSSRKHSTGEYRPLYQFDLSSIPAGARVTGATLRLWVTDAESSAVGVYRVTQSWSESTLTWANSGGVAHNGTAIASFTPAASGRYYDINVTTLVNLWRTGTANFGLILKIGGGNTLASYTSSEWANAAQRPQLVVVADPPPNFTIVRSNSVISDPLNAGVNPKAIPGAMVNYTLVVSNTSVGYADSGTTRVTDAVPSNMQMFVGDVGAAGSGPLAFTNGTVASGLSYSYAGLGNTLDSLSFSNDGGVSFNYTPVPDANGCDPNITHFRINPSGIFAGQSGMTSPSFQIQFRMRVK